MSFGLHSIRLRASDLDPNVLFGLFVLRIILLFLLAPPFNSAGGLAFEVFDILHKPIKRVAQIPRAIAHTSEIIDPTAIALLTAHIKQPIAHIAVMPMQKRDIMNALVIAQTTSGTVPDLSHEFQVSFFSCFFKSAMLVSGPIGDLPSKVILTLDVRELHAAVHNTFIDFVVAAGNNPAHSVKGGWVVRPTSA